MALDSTSLDVGFSTETDLNSVSSHQDYYNADGNSYLDVLALCDYNEPVVSVPDTQNNISNEELCDTIWDSSEQKPKFSDYQKRKLKDYDINETGMKSSGLVNKKNKTVKHKNLLKQKNKKAVRKYDYTDFIELFSDEPLDTPIQTVPPNSPFDGIKVDSSYNSPFISCLLEILEQSQMNSPSKECKESPFVSQENLSSNLPPSFCTNDESPCPDILCPASPCNYRISVQALDDHVVPQLNHPEDQNTHVSDIFYEMSTSSHFRVLQSCTSLDHIVPDFIEE